MARKKVEQTPIPPAEGQEDLRAVRLFLPRAPEDAAQARRRARNQHGKSGPAQSCPSTCSSTRRRGMPDSATRSNLAQASHITGRSFSAHGITEIQLLGKFTTNAESKDPPDWEVSRRG